MKEAALRAASTKDGGRLRRPPPFVDSFMDGFVEAKEAAGAAQTHVNLGKTCTCMHILRATSDPQGHHGRAQRPGEQGFSNVFTNTKKTRSVRTIILPAVSRRDLCYASENEGFRFYQIPPSPSTFAVDSHEHGFDKPPLASYPKWFHLGSEGALFLWLVPEGGDLTLGFRWISLDFDGFLLIFYEF